MIRLGISVEGKTEREFSKDTLAAWLWFGRDPAGRTASVFDLKKYHSSKMREAV